MKFVVSRLTYNLSYCVRPSVFSRSKKCFSTAAEPAAAPQSSDNGKMMAWQIHSYGGLEELQLSKSTRVPPLLKPTDVLVKVLSSSVNPIDLAMMNGYGSTMFNTMRQVASCSFNQPLEFPLTLGRDFCGCVEGKGLAVTKLKVGDLVWGTTAPHNQGCHAQKVVVNEALVRHKPATLNNVEAGSMLYTAVTAWSALRVTGDFLLVPTERKRVLVLGASGGVGLMAVQLLKAWGCQVVATCRGDAAPLLESFGVDSIIDYTQPEVNRAITEEGKYDVVLDCAGLGASAAPAFANCLREWSFSKYITLSSPVLRNVDSYGVVGGMIKNALDLAVPNVTLLQSSKSSTVRWAFFSPLPQAFDEITSLVEAGKVRPTVEEVHPFGELPSAYERVSRGHLRGKVVVSMEEGGRSGAADLP